MSKNSTSISGTTWFSGTINLKLNIREEPKIFTEFNDKDRYGIKQTFHSGIYLSGGTPLFCFFEKQWKTKSES